MAGKKGVNPFAKGNVAKGKETMKEEKMEMGKGKMPIKNGGKAKGKGKKC